MCVLSSIFMTSISQFSPQRSFTSLVKYIPGLWFPGACCKWFPFLILISDNLLLHSNTSKTTDRGGGFYTWPRWYIRLLVLMAFKWHLRSFIRLWHTVLSDADWAKPLPSPWAVAQSFLWRRREGNAATMNWVLEGAVVQDPVGHLLPCAFALIPKILKRKGLSTRRQAPSSRWSCAGGRLNLTVKAIPTIGLAAACNAASTQLNPAQSGSPPHLTTGELRRS